MKTGSTFLMLLLASVLSFNLFAQNDNNVIKVGDYYRLKMKCLEDTNEVAYIEVADSNFFHYVESLMMAFANVSQTGSSEEYPVRTRMVLNNSVVYDGNTSVEALILEGHTCVGTMQRFNSKTYYLLFATQDEIVGLSDEVLGRNRIVPQNYYNAAEKENRVYQDQRLANVYDEFDAYYESGRTRLITGVVFCSVGAMLEAVGGILFSKNENKAASGCCIAGGALLTVGIPLSIVGDERMTCSEVMRRTYDLMRKK